MMTKEQLDELYAEVERHRIAWIEALERWQQAKLESVDAPPVRRDVALADTKWERELSIRSRKALKALNIKFLSEIDEVRLINLKGCGMTTVHDLMEWKRTHLPETIVRDLALNQTRWQQELSPMARNILIREGITRISDITVERLRKVSPAVTAVIEEILSWRWQYLPNGSTGCTEVR